MKRSLQLNHPHVTSRRSRFLLRLTGLLALAWYLVRVVPKPSRAAYPCMRATAPVAWGFTAWLASGAGAWLAFRKARCFLRRRRYAPALLGLLVGLAIAIWNLNLTARETLAEQTGTFVPSDSPNAPIGVARGIRPGRVVWSHDSRATSWDSHGFWWEDTYNDQAAINQMLADTVRGVTDQGFLPSAWDQIFRYFNEQAGKGDTGYQVGEKLVIKVNLNNYGGDNQIDASPHMVFALLQQLVNEAGVAQTNIIVYDAQRTGMDSIRSHCEPTFPDIGYNTWGGWVATQITYSAEVTNLEARRLPQCVLDADYMVNMALLKRHCQPTDQFNENLGQTGVTLCGKNHLGTIGFPGWLHMSIRDWDEPMGGYNPVVDLMGSRQMGGKTILYLIDGLYSANRWDAPPAKWALSPFNYDWPSSLFGSLDPVAIDSVGLDFLRAEWPLVANADNYLHEAALVPAPPSGITYQPDGLPLTNSLGVHEHWNNSTDKQYSRNLGTGAGIELYLPRTDNDGDGMRDDWELTYFNSTTNSAGRTDEDWDHDGLTDMCEYVAGSDPTNPASLLQIVSVSPGPDGQMVLRWSSSSNRVYALLGATNTVSPRWTPIADHLAPDPPMNFYTVRVSTTSARLYRVTVTPE